MLQVPVPELEPFVRARTGHYDTDYLSTDPGFVHAHVTALAPFLDGADLTAEVLDKVAEIASTTRHFDFTLAELDTFPNGIVHLLPEPTGPSPTSPRGSGPPSRSARRMPAGSVTSSRT